MPPDFVEKKLKELGIITDDPGKIKFKRSFKEKKFSKAYDGPQDNRHQVNNKTHYEKRQ